MVIDHFERRLAGVPALVVLAFVFLRGAPAAAQASPAPMHNDLEFTHPLVAESISPDTKFRLEFDRMRRPEEASLGLEGEYAFAPSVSLECGIPLARRDGGRTAGLPGPVELRGKYAHYLGTTAAIGGGATALIPTQALPPAAGGRRPYGLEPFVDGGVRRGAWEWVGFVRIALTAHSPPGEAGASLGYNGSALFKASSTVHALAELEGGMPLDGAAAGEATLALSPGVEVWPGLGPHVMFGASLSLPLLVHREFASELALSAFYHF